MQIESVCTYCKRLQYICKIIKITMKRIIVVGRSTMTPVTIVYHSFIYHMYNLTTLHTVMVNSTYTDDTVYIKIAGCGLCMYAMYS